MNDRGRIATLAAYQYRVVPSPHLDHGTMILAGETLLIGTAPLDRAERIRRAARHEARMIVHGRAVELGLPVEPLPNHWDGYLPEDDLQVRFVGAAGARWDWPDLDTELDAARVDANTAEQRRRDHELDLPGGVRLTEDERVPPNTMRVVHPPTGVTSVDTPERAGRKETDR